MMDLATMLSLEKLQEQDLAGWRETDGHGSWALMPTTAQQVADLLHWAAESNRPMAMNAAESALLADPLWLDISRLNRIRDHAVADFTIQVESGITMRELAQHLTAEKQEFPLSYAPDLKLMDVLAEDRPALETGLRGFPRDAVLKTEIATPDGQLTISGADVVKNVTGYDLHKLYVGSHHALGVITAVTLKLTALPPRHETWLYTLDSAPAAFDLVEKLLASQLPMRICELIREAHGWRILVQIAGDKLLLAECGAVMAGLSDHQPRLLGKKEVLHFLQLAQEWPEYTYVLEAALPLGQWPAFVTQLLQQSAYQGWRFQIRPAAGLVYLATADLAPETAKAVAEEAKQAGGFLQVLRAPAGEWAALAELNLPQDVIVRRLLKTLKNGYDPKRILFCPRLPL